MTMPHLMNCPHSEDGWCLSCVKELWEEGTTVELNRQLSISVDGQRWSVGQVVAIKPIDTSCSVHEVPGNDSDIIRHFAPADEIATELKVTCVSRRASDG